MEILASYLAGAWHPGRGDGHQCCSTPTCIAAIAPEARMLTPDSATSATRSRPGSTTPSAASTAAMR